MQKRAPASDGGEKGRCLMSAKLTAAGHAEPAAHALQSLQCTAATVIAVTKGIVTTQVQ